MSKHTPGPWTDKSIDESQWGIYDSNGNQVAQAQQLKPLKEDLKQVERTDNTRLIASAPELLQALKLMLDASSIECAFDEEIGIKAVENAREIIAKATGEQP